MTTTTTTARPDVNEMRVIHRVFRRELAALPGLVRRVPDGHTERADVVGGHADFMLGALHSHHTGEDEFLWPLLLERAAPSTELVTTMQSQHEQVHDALDDCHTLLERWRAGADRAVGERLATALEQLDDVLVEHLDQEEREILPLAEEHLTVAEWAKLGEHGRGSMPRSRLPLMFGAILEEADPSESARMLAEVPAPVRVLLRTVGARQYRRYISRVRAG